jgi:hypothetical protein
MRGISVFLALLLLSRVHGFDGWSNQSDAGVSGRKNPCSFAAWGRPLCVGITLIQSAASKGACNSFSISFFFFQWFFFLNFVLIKLLLRRVDNGLVRKHITKNMDCFISILYPCAQIFI